MADTAIALDHLDVANIPSMQRFRFRNDSDEVWARLSYSNAALLETLGVHYAEDLPGTWPATPPVGDRTTLTAELSEALAGLRKPQARPGSGSVLVTWPWRWPTA